MSNYSLRHFFRIRNNLYTPILPNKKQQSMPRPKGSVNKVTAEVKEQLQSSIDEVVNRIDVDAMTTDQKLKLLQLSLHYVLPKLKSTETTDKKQEDLPLFVD